jgi:acyl-CoA dehydrogenase
MSAEAAGPEAPGVEPAGVSRAGPLADTLRAMFEAQCTPERIAAAEGGWDTQLWNTLETSGYTTIGVAEDSGGSGGTLADAATVAWWCGRYAAPISLPDSLLVGQWLWTLGGEPCARGPVALAWLDGHADAMGGPADSGMTGARATGVRWLPGAGRLLLAARRPGGATVFAPEPDAVAVTTATDVAGEPVSAVQMVRAAPVAVELDDGRCRELMLRQALARALVISGAVTAATDLTFTYARDRRQFGRSIASFQAVRQLLSALAGEEAVSSAAVSSAAAALAAGPDEAQLPVLAARVRAGQAAAAASRLAHQVHGAMGTTREYRLQQFTRRLWAWADADGSQATWTARLGEYILARGGAGLWPVLVPDGPRS